MNCYLSRSECTALRAIAITGIVCHNYCHWLPDIIRENEYRFRAANADGLLAVLGSPDGMLPVHLLSFFGHYGVPLFLFLSAYGLVMKYEGGDASQCSGESAATFLAKHFSKLFSLMFVGFMTFLLIDNIIPRPHHYRFADVIGQLFMVSNLYSHPERVVWPGPYWFFGLMIQLYIVYRMFIYGRHTYKTLILMVLCVCVQMTMGADSQELNDYRYNFPGGMLPFGMGVLWGRWVKGQHWHHGAGVVLVDNTTNANGWWQWLTLLSLSLAAVVAGSMNFYSWTFVPVFAVLASIAFIKLLPGRAVGVLQPLGALSAFLFIAHPSVRKVFISNYSHTDVYAGILLYLMLSLALAWAMRIVVRKLTA